VCPNTRIAGNGIMPYFPVEFKDQNALNVMVHINLNTTDTLYSVAKVITRLIFPDWKLFVLGYLLLTCFFYSYALPIF